MVIKGAWGPWSGEMKVRKEWKSPFVVFLLATTQVGFSSGADLMLQVAAGREECFFENVEANKTLFVDYSVVSSNQGELDINFQLSDARKKLFVLVVVVHNRGYKFH